MIDNIKAEIISILQPANVEILNAWMRHEDKEFLNLDPKRKRRTYFLALSTQVGFEIEINVGIYQCLLDDSFPDATEEILWRIALAFIGNNPQEYHRLWRLLRQEGEIDVHAS